ncbi:MuDR family transposase [Abeliophyllum distichum]|uniref:MuDR family transposase n=1 Tax=Abeliophyllum distichum TaxID=126358 RepID=A0ABD1VB07_9LAMI
MSVLKLDKRSNSLSIQYEVVGCLSSMKITNDNTLIFYLELKRKNQNLTSYPLQIDVTRSLENIPLIYTLDISGDHEMKRLEQQHLNSNSLLNTSNNSLCYLNSFASSVCDTIPELPELQIHDDNSVIGQPDFDSISAGRIFRDKNVLKNTISLYDIHNNFQYKVYRSDKEEYVLKCLDDNCMWHFRASRLIDTELFKIRYIKNGHNCSMDYVMGDHRQATSSLLAECIQHKYMDAKTIYTPMDIINDTSKTYDVTLSYRKVWRARESILEKIVGEPEDSYNKLSSFLYMLSLKIQGTITRTKTNADNQFEYMFMALRTSVQGWKHCKPIVVVDATFLTGHYGGTLFMACTQDANYNIFVLALGIGDAENNNAWE